MRIYILQYICKVVPLLVKPVNDVITYHLNSAAVVVQSKLIIFLYFFQDPRNVLRHSLKKIKITFKKCNSKKMEISIRISFMLHLT